MLLLHGWTASADLNWFPEYGPLSERYSVLAIDHRGHGRGIRPQGRFRLADCADDAAAACAALGIEQVIAVGYSMGGPIAQLLWHRHRRLVRGLVLCATARNFRGRPVERVWFRALGGLSTVVRNTPSSWRRRAALRFLEGRTGEGHYGDWAIQEFARGDAGAIIEAGSALGHFSSHEWIGEVDVPTSVVLTERDEVVPPRRQRKLADAIPGATVHAIDGDHTCCVNHPELFIPALLAACDDASADPRTRPGPRSAPAAGAPPHGSGATARP